MTPALPLRVLAPAILAAVAWLAVLLQLWLSVQLVIGNGKSIVDGIIVFLGYFTILTNIFVALVASAGARSNGPTLWLYRPSVVGCATTAILLVSIAYHLLLREIWSPQGAVSCLRTCTRRTSGLVSVSVHRCPHAWVPTGTTQCGWAVGRIRRLRLCGAGTCPSCSQEPCSMKARSNPSVAPVLLQRVSPASASA